MAANISIKISKHNAMSLRSPLCLQKNPRFFVVERNARKHGLGYRIREHFIGLRRMTSSLVLKSSADSVSEMVNKTKVLVDRLRCAIIHQDNLTKACFDTNAKELSKTVESIKNSYLKLEAEYQGVKEEIKEGEKRLNDITEEYKKIVDENARLKNVENGFSNSKTVAVEHERMAKELRETLQAYKLLTGVRFDYNDSADALTGYVAICGDKPSNSTLIPFEIDATNSNSKNILWDKISEACLEISD